MVGVVTCNLKQSKKKPRARSAKLQVDGSRTGNMGVMGGTWVPASGRPPTANSAPSSAIGRRLRPAQGMGRFCASLRGVRPRPGSATLRLCLPCPGYSSRTGQGLPYHSPVWPVTSPRPILRSHSFFPSLLFRGRTSPPNPVRCDTGVTTSILCEGREWESGGEGYCSVGPSTTINQSSPSQNIELRSTEQMNGNSSNERDSSPLLIIQVHLYDCKKMSK